jgi:hypothetical protein
MTCGDLNFFKDILAKFKLNQVTYDKLQLVQKSHGRVKMKSNDLW